MLRSSSPATHGDVESFFNYVHFDQKLLVLDQKSNRHMDYKRHVNAALGISPDESPSSSAKGKLLPSPVPEDVKRMRENLYSSTVKARERVKMFNEALSVFNEVFPTVNVKKRSRVEGFSSDRSSVLLNDRSVSGPSMGKVGVQGHPVTGGFELDQQKSEERTKNLGPNKRPRTSMADLKMDVRTNSLVRPPGTVDRDKEKLRIANNGVVQSEERSLPIVGDGWETSKMKKKKRSCIKLDVSPSTALNKPVNGFQETKQGMQQRLTTDSRSKLSNDSNSFRLGVSNGTVAAGKSDGISQQTGLGIRTPIQRNGQDNNSLVSDKRGRSVSSDKERVTFRAVNKATVRDEFNSSSPTSSTKMSTAIRAPRSSSGVAPKMSPVVHRTAVPNDWELSHCATKPPAGVNSTNNRKRAASARSSSPPVVPWQRPQKSSRTARRTSFVPVVSSNDEAPALDAVSDVAGNDIGIGFVRRSAGSSPQQIKLKGEPSPSAGLSESEESGLAEVKPKEKGRKPEEIDLKPGQNVPKVSNFVTRKSKLVSGEELGDGVRRQGRTGRSFNATRSLTPMTSEKLGNIGTAKQLRSARLGCDKNESKVGRPPTRKLSDRKAYARQKPTSISAAADYFVGSEDGHGELLAAVKGVINSAYSFSSPFWKQMEPFFSLISEEDITYWKQKVTLESSTLTPTPVPSIDSETIVNRYGLVDCERNVRSDVQRSAGTNSEKLPLPKGSHNMVPLCQRLIAALISEEDRSGGNEDFKFDAYDTESEPDGELELSDLDCRSLTNFQFARHSAYNGYGVIGMPAHDETESDMIDIPNFGLNPSFGNSVNGFLHDKALMSGLACSELQYNSMGINDKLLLELQSIGLDLEPVPEMVQEDDEAILEDITRLDELHQEQVSKKKNLLDGLLKSASAAKELQEKDFDQRALDQLVVTAYEKYTACRGSSASGGKNSSNNKMVKQAASAFVKWTLEQYHQFEDTGKSCFSEPLFKDMFLTASSQHSIVRHSDGLEADSRKPYTSSLSLKATTASMGSQQSPSQFCQNMDNLDLTSSDMLPALNHSSEQTTGKEDLWSNRVKKRELFLDDVGGTQGNSSAPGIGSSLTSSAKGKRSERDRDGKGNGREVLSRNGTTKAGRQASSSAKGERKAKTKPKQKATQHSVSVNGLLGKLSEQPKPALPSVSKPVEKPSNRNAKEKDEFLGGFDEPIDLSNLQLPGMDVLGDPGDLADQGQDIGSWLNIDDDVLQDHDDFMGLEIPMDDLSDLNMMV
ncbi:unnamed protein product [Trifolium pratense]|nr:unnamed protein product [Trifolium pratense]